MNYKGKELKDISGTPQIIDPPRDMLVWDDDPKNMLCRPVSEPLIVRVVAIVNSNKLNGKVIAETESSFVRYGHCAEIPKPRRATNRELAKWLAQGNGEMQDESSLNCVFTVLNYGPFCDDYSASDIYKVRKWNDTDWHEPDVQYMGIE